MDSDMQPAPVSRAVCIAGALAALGAAVVGGAPGTEDAGAHLGHPPALVDVGARGFSPARVGIFAGDSVLWGGSAPRHSVTSDPGQPIHIDTDPDTPPGLVDHPPGFGASAQFNRVGTFTFHDKVHPPLRATVVVTPSPPGSGPIPGPTPPPALSSASLSRACGGRSGRRCGRAVTVAYRVSAPCTMQFHVWTQRRGRQVGLVRRLTGPDGRPGRVNRYRLALTGLRPGDYEVWVLATDNTGNIADPLRLPLRVGRGGRGRAGRR